MAIVKAIVVNLVFALTVVSAAQAKESPLKGVKVGFGFDQGFSIVGSLGRSNAALGDDGVAVDYIFMEDKLNLEIKAPTIWFISGGGFVEWDGDFGARLPIGAELYFAKNLDAYAAAIPRLRFNNNDKNDDVDFGLDFAIGVRYQF